MTNIRHSLGWSYGTKYALLAVQFVSTVVIARLVTPDDIGIYTVAAVFIGLGQLLREFGVNRYIIQETDLTSDRIRAASTLNLLLGWGTGILVFLASGPIGEFYGRTEVREVMRLLSVNFIFVPLGAIIFAYLRREMRFREIMLIRVASAIVGACVGIATAWHGEGYRALVWSAIAGTATTVFLCLSYRPKDISLMPGIREIGHVFVFCRYAGAESIIGHLGNSAPDWILGKVLGMQMVGLFSRAAGTINLFSALVMEGLVGVLLPHFAKELREGRESRTSYLHAVGCICGLAWPFFALLGLLAAPFIETLYGSQWRDAAPLVQLMCIGAFPYTLTFIAADALTGLGKIRPVFRITLSMAMVNVILILLSAPYGLLAVAATMQLGSLIRLALVNRQITRHIDVRLRDMTHMMASNLLVSLITALPAIAAVALYGWTLDYSIPLLLIVLTTSALCWLAAIYVIKPPVYLEVSPVMQWLARLIPARSHR